MDKRGPIYQHVTGATKQVLVVRGTKKEEEKLAFC